MPDHERYKSMIRLRLTSAGGTNTVLGTVLLDEPTFVAVNDQWVEFPATGNLLLASHTDRPGIIGKVGTLLGRSDVNISFMHVGRRAPRGEAIMVLGTDEQTPALVLKELAEIQDIRWLKVVDLREKL
jgi:L-serine deaminase